jgi:AcrR family transcriptional regulator
MEVAAADGLDACSFRRLAAELDVTAMAVSYHVSTRRDLLLAMINLAFAELNSPLESDTSKERLRELLIRYVQFGEEYTYLVRAALQDPYLMQAQLLEFTNALRMETQAVNSGDNADELLNLLVDYAHGHIFAVAAAPKGEGPDLATFLRSLDWVLDRLD